MTAPPRPLTTAVADAYGRAAAAWQAGAGPVYDRLADTALAHSPVPVAGAAVLDVGAGTGAASRAALRLGAASVVAVDVAPGMLGHDAAARPPAVVADGSRLPVGAGTFDLVVAAFSLNHMAQPATGLAEAARVVRGGGGLVATTYAATDHHPVKEAVDQAATALGWRPEPWYISLKEQAVARLATVDGARAEAAAAGLDGAHAVQVTVPFPDLADDDLVAWRLGMAHVAPFACSLGPDRRAALARDALARLGPHAPRLSRTVVVLTWRRAGG